LPTWPTGDAFILPCCLRSFYLGTRSIVFFSESEWSRKSHSEEFKWQKKTSNQAPWRRGIRTKLFFPLLEKCPVFYRTQKFFTTFTTACYFFCVLCQITPSSHPSILLLGDIGVHSF
jgi:hypothetical protein